MHVCSRQRLYAEEILYNWPQVQFLERFSNQCSFLKMEGRGAQLFVSNKGVAMREKKASEGLERESIEVVNSGLVYEAMAETHHTSLSHMAHITAANLNPTSPQFNIVNGGMRPLLCEGAFKLPPANKPLTPLAFPSILIRGFPPSNPFSKESNQRGLGPPYGNCEMGPHGGMSRILLPSQTQSNKFDVKNSELCQRRFVMFDEVGSTRRMIFHPAMMNKFSTSIPSSLLKPALLSSERLGSYSFPDEAASCKDTIDESPLSVCIAPLGASFPYYNPHVPPMNRCMNSLSSTSDNCVAPLLSKKNNVEAKMDPILGRIPEHSSYFHENTEDLEALLSSDEEDEVSSTGHSPSDLTRNNSPEDGLSKSEGYNVCPSKKRKRGAEGHIDDDTCSTATSGNNMCKETLCQDVDGVGNFSGYGNQGCGFLRATTHFKDLGYGNEDLEMFDLFLSDDVSSSSSANIQKRGTKLPCMQQQPDGQSKKEKIKNILRLLRGIIPGGESMGTTFVLDETIQYVRTLQFEVQKLQAKKLT